MQLWEAEERTLLDGRIGLLERGYARFAILARPDRARQIRARSDRPLESQSFGDRLVLLILR